MSLTAADARARLHAQASPEHARVLQGYFKTGPGEYGEGDVFAGVRLPALRALAKELRALPLEEVTEILRSPVHEERLLALLLLVLAYPKGDEAKRQAVYDLYLASTRFINNWDLVDSSAEHVVGAHLWTRDRGVLDRLARSESVWERRTAILATFHFIRRGHFGDTLRIAGALLDDRHDLIHKAVGWMLREVGKRDADAERAFLRAHARRMPRTMLRYAIERFPEAERRGWLSGELAEDGPRSG